MLSMFVESNADPDCDVLARWVILRLDMMLLLTSFVTERMMTVEMIVRRISEGFSDHKKKDTSIIDWVASKCYSNQQISLKSALFFPLVLFWPADKDDKCIWRGILSNINLSSQQRGRSTEDVREYSIDFRFP